jgi:CDGSH-type Zn-finger protein
VIVTTRQDAGNESERDEAKIRVKKNSHYIVTGGIPLSSQSIKTDADGDAHGWKLEKEFAVPDEYELCRCGQSKTKPFCDGSHREVAFDGTETASREPYLDQAERTAGPSLDLTAAMHLCAAARYCQRAGTIWDLTSRSDDPAARQAAIEEAADCPSGAIVMWDREGKAVEPDFEPSIVLVEDPEKDVSGPIWVRGGIEIESADGSAYERRNRVALCRCGKSHNKPFCDGRHLEK